MARSWSRPARPGRTGRSTCSTTRAAGSRIGDAAWEATARLLEGPQHAEAVRDLILRYGTPAENLGSGPAFELTPVTEATAT